MLREKTYKNKPKRKKISHGKKTKSSFINRKKQIENNDSSIFNTQIYGPLSFDIEDASLQSKTGNSINEIFLSLLIEQWKTAVDFAKELSVRRLSMNGLFMTGLSLILSGVLFGNGISQLSKLQYSLIVLVICIAGIGLCKLWIDQLKYYSSLSSVKYRALREIEKYVPAYIINFEDYYFYAKNNSFSKIEQLIPKTFIIVFIFIMIIIVGIPITIIVANIVNHVLQTILNYV